jgi:hypothetical protein
MLCLDDAWRRFSQREELRQYDQPLEQYRQLFAKHAIFLSTFSSCQVKFDWKKNLTDIGGVGLTIPSSFINPNTSLFVGLAASSIFQGMGRQLDSYSQGSARSCAVSQSSRLETVLAIGPKPALTDSEPLLTPLTPAAGILPFDGFKAPKYLISL